MKKKHWDCIETSQSSEYWCFSFNNLVKKFSTRPLRLPLHMDSQKHDNPQWWRLSVKKKKFELQISFVLTTSGVFFLVSCYWHLVSYLPLVCPSCPLQSSPLYLGCLDPPPPWNQHKDILSNHSHKHLNKYSLTLLSWTQWDLTKTF